MYRRARSLVNKVTTIALTCWAFSHAEFAVGQQSDLRYGPKAGESFGYEIEINVDSNARITTFKGLARYTVSAVTGEQISLAYVGGLSESSKAKPAPAGSGRFPAGFGGPRGFGDPPGFPGPPGFFGRQEFAGKHPGTRNQITLTPTGGVLAMEGDSQLPYLLGNVSLIPFEVLPSAREREWKYDAGVAIQQKDGNNRLPFGPFAQQPNQQQAGQEVTDYAIQSEDAQKITVKKSYRLSTPQVQGKPAFNLSGSGTWVFNRQLRMSESLDFKQQLVIVDGQDQMTVPISITYRRLTAEAIAKLDQEAQQRQKEREQKMAAAKQQAEAPLTSQEKQNALASLISGDSSKLDAAFKLLRGKSPKEPDPEIASAVESLLTHPNPKVQEDAKATLLKWSPGFAKRHKLNEAYAGHMPVESTEREVNSATPLYIGQILQFQEHGSFWFAGEVLELLPDGKVKIRKRGFAPRELTLLRRNLQLAPDEVAQPRKPATAVTSTASASTRTWTDATGEHKIEAAYLVLTDGKVKMQRTDGKEIAVPLDKLSQDDQQYVQKLQSAKKTRSPFE